MPPFLFSPRHDGYSSRRAPLGLVNEFREMVKALHRAGIEIILDVVFNHTAEGGVPAGPVLSLRGLDNPTDDILSDPRSSRTIPGLYGLWQHAGRQRGPSGG